MSEQWIKILIDERISNPLYFIWERKKNQFFFRVKQGTKIGQPLAYFYILVRIVKKVKTVNTCFKPRLLDLKIVALFLQSWVVQKKTQKDLMIKLRLWLKGQNCWLNFFLLFQSSHQQKTTTYMNPSYVNLWTGINSN